MGNGKTSKINQLISKWPRGTLATASYLKQQGFTYDLLTKYRRSGWIKSFGQGAYILPEDRVEWPGALYAVQSQLELEVHAGGKTALELKGYGHYVSEETRVLFLYAQPGMVLPVWFSGERFSLRLVVTRTSLFPVNNREGFSDWKEREFSIRISSPERAAMEMLYLVPEKVSFEESLLIMESLVTLRPEIVQKLLEICRFVKVKRLFMYMAEKHRHPWVEKLDLSRIDFGRGKRRIVSGGELDPKYQITVPRESREGTV
jgi:hypothetical protein